MIDIQNHIRNEGLLNLFDGRGVAPTMKPMDLSEASLKSAIEQIELMTWCQREIMFITGHAPET